MYSGLKEHYRTTIPTMMEEQNIPGLSIVLINHVGEIWIEAFGYTDLDKHTPVTADTMFSIQSVSKTFTAVAVLIAVQHGLLDLDVSIKAYLPEFTVQSRYGENSEREITLRHLLSHTAGFTHEAPIGNNFSGAPSFEAHIASISDTWLRYPVGERYSYSNLGIDLAAHILQVVSGKQFSRIMQETLFAPLGMINSSTSFSAIKEKRNRAIGHSNGKKAERLDIPMLGAGGVYTSVADMARFMRCFLNDGQIDDYHLLDPAFVKEMYTVPFAVEDQTGGYALGIVKMRQHNTCLMTHSGGGFGFLADMAWYPELGIGAAILTNSTSHNLQWKLCNQVLDRAIQVTTGGIPDMEPSKVHKIVDLNLDKAEQLSGDYVGRFGMLEIRVKGKTLGIQSGDKFRPFTFTSNTDACTDEQDRYRFMFTAEGHPSHIVSLNDGETWDYNGGPADKPGQNKPEWRELVGEYAVKVAGCSVASTKIYISNGYLYATYMGLGLRLEEYQPGLFFTSNGEALDLRKNPTFAGVFELEKN